VLKWYYLHCAELVRAVDIKTYIDLVMYLLTSVTLIYGLYVIVSLRDEAKLLKRFK